MTPNPGKTPEQRFWGKVDAPDDPDKCWLWSAATNGVGYGRLYIGPKKWVLAHRFAYEILVGPIPEGMTLDHVKARGCTNTLCVNPAHLEPVSLKTNILRGISMCALHARKNHCPQGHPYNEENTQIYNGTRYCRTCIREHNKVDHHKNRQTIKKARRE